MNVSAPDQAEQALTACQQHAEALGMAFGRGEPLARHTTFRIGGPADLYVTATTVAQLAALVRLANDHAAPVTILGGGSNILVSDAGIRGVVINNATRGFGLGAAYRPDWLPEACGAGRLAAESGVAVAGLARWTVRQGFAGLEWAVSVPGTVGGAVIGNAGAHGGDVAANLAWALVQFGGAAPSVLRRVDLQYAYRTSLLKRLGHAATPVAERPVVLAAAFDLTPGDAAELTARADGFLARRRASQPAEPSAGSIFRNPPGDYAGRLIEAAGLKGRTIGGAQISPLHANFIVNTGGAQAADVLALINLVRRTIWEQHGVLLAPEILFLGDWAAASLWEP